MNKRPMTTADLALLRCLSWVDISPDGNCLAWTEHRSDEKDGKWYSRIHTSAGIALHEEAVSTQMPLFSPDGQYLYFLCNADGEMQLYRCAASETVSVEKAQKLTALRHGLTNYQLGSDGKTIVFECPLWANEIADGSALREMNAEERAEFEYQREWGPREITQIDYKHDSCKGVRDGSVPTIGVLNVETEEIRLISCSFPLLDPALSQDCTSIACFGQPHTDAKWSRKELFTVSVDGSGLKALTDGGSLSGSDGPAFTLDGSQIVYPGWYMGERGYCESLYRIPVDGGESVCLMDHQNDTVSSGYHAYPGSRTEYGKRRSLFCVKENCVHFLGAFNGTERLYAISLEGKQLPVQLLGGEYSIHEFACAKNGQMLVLRGDDHHFGEPFTVSPEGSFERVYDANSWLKEIQQGEVIIRNVPSKDGKVTIRSRVTAPAFRKEGEKYPAVLYIHGGPETCFTTDLWHEVQILAGAGYAVVCCDPRGSSGYGVEFCSDDDSWGQEALDDLMACLDDAISLGFIDSDRMGVTGGSYGGYTTCRIIMKMNRFRAAVAQRTFVNKATSYGTGDIGFYSARMKPEDVVVADCLKQRATTSIITGIDNVNTPLLLLHGYRDYRCSFEQSEQMFIAIHERRPEVPVRLVMFPEENHEVSRSGLLRHRQVHVDEMIKWFDTYVKEVQA